MRDLRHNTATRITVGPFMDKTDGITPKTSLTVTSEHLTFIVDTAGVPTLILDVAPTASGGSNDMVHVTNDDAGYYDLELAAADVNYYGRAMLCLNDVATHVPVFHEFEIIAEVEYDRKYATSGGNLPNAVAGASGGVPLSVDASGRVDVLKVNGTSQTSRDLGASVLLSPGTGTGQLDFTSGVVKANLVQILGAAITGTAAQIVAAFTKFFDKASPTGTVNSLPDAVPGAANGLPTTNGTVVNQTVGLTAGQSIAVSDKTGFSLSVSGILAIWNQLTADVGIVANSFGAKLKNWVLGTDYKAVISTDAQDLSATFSVNTKKIGGTTQTAGDIMGALNSLDTSATVAAAVRTNLTTELANIVTMAGQLTGITSLAKWLRGLFRKSAMDATAKTEVNSGGGTYDETTDSLEAQLDSRPAAPNNPILGADGKVVISTDAQDLSGTLSVNAKKLNGAVPTNLAQGAKMDMIDHPNPTAIIDLQAGLAKEGADGDTLETLSDQLDEVEITADDAGILGMAG